MKLLKMKLNMCIRKEHRERPWLDTEIGGRGCYLDGLEEYIEGEEKRT